MTYSTLIETRRECLISCSDYFTNPHAECPEPLNCTEGNSHYPTVCSDAVHPYMTQQDVDSLPDAKGPANSGPEGRGIAIPDSLVLAFRKSGCDFECPTYGLEVYSDGEVHFHGRTNTVVLGEATKHVTTSTLKEIKAALKEAGFGERAGSLGVVSADDALVTVRWCDAEGCDERTFFESDKSISPGFMRFEAELSKILSLEEWVGRRK